MQSKKLLCMLKFIILNEFKLDFLRLTQLEIMRLKVGVLFTRFFYGNKTPNLSLIKFRRHFHAFRDAYIFNLYKEE